MALAIFFVKKRTKNELYDIIKKNLTRRVYRNDRIEIINIIETTLEEKIEQNQNFIRYTFYEIIVKHNLSKKDEILFNSLIRNKLYNLGYTVYFRGASYKYEGKQMIIEDNELLIAIRKVEERMQSNGRKTKKSKHR